MALFQSRSAAAFARSEAGLCSETGAASLIDWNFLVTIGKYPVKISQLEPWLGCDRCVTGFCCRSRSNRRLQPELHNDSRFPIRVIVIVDSP